MQKATVLIVDDDESVRAVLSEMLECLGHVAVVTPDGAAAARAAQVGAFDMVLIDVQMPVQDGFQTLLMLRELVPDTHCVMMSGGGNQALEAVCLQEGAVECLRKPIGLETLQSLVDRLRGGHGAY